MGENHKTKTKVSMNSSEEIDFQSYVDSLKHKKIPWEMFEKVLKDISYSDIDRLKYLNEILLDELTMNFSDIDKLRYLNSILLTEFKEFVQTQKDKSYSENEHTDDELNEIHTNISDLADEIIKKEYEIQLVERIEEESKDSLPNSPINSTIVYNQRKEFQMQIFSDSTDEIIHEESDAELKEVIENEMEDNSLNLPTKYDVIGTQSEANMKKFPCYLCNKEYSIHFHLKQHIRKIHEAKPNHTSFSKEFDQNAHNDSNHELLRDDKFEVNNLLTRKKNISKVESYSCDSCGKSFSWASNLKRHNHTIHLGHKDHKCSIFGKSFTQASDLKTHNHVIHEGKDHKCKT